jgi:hypothetical protein
VARKLDEAEAPVRLPVPLQALEHIEPTDDRLSRDVENGLLPRSHLPLEEHPVGLLQTQRPETGRPLRGIGVALGDGLAHALILALPQSRLRAAA